MKTLIKYTREGENTALQIQKGLNEAEIAGLLLALSNYVQVEGLDEDEILKILIDRVSEPTKVVTLVSKILLELSQHYELSDLAMSSFAKNLNDLN